MEEQVSPAPIRQSRLGKRPVVVPKGVSVSLGPVVEVKGPKGAVKRSFPDGIEFKQEDAAIRVDASGTGPDAPRLQGLGRALLASMVKGCAEGFERILELHGTGYRAELKGKTLTLNVGKSHPHVYELPADVSATIPGDSKGTVLILTSANKELLGQVASKLRGFRPPEPYGGKGVRYRGETIRRKAGKSGKKK